MGLTNEQMIEWVKDDGGDPNGFVTVCKHIASKKYPVLVLEVGFAFDEGRSGWEAICNQSEKELAGDDCRAEDYVNWTMKEFLEYEPSLKELIKDYTNTQISRIDSKSPWKIIH